ncbi:MULTISPECIES: hypothetical protein [Sphingobacterium]|uniref:hypothetical protein n=1 Tax=Sphingobacterium TaxID=28453 RepID=UPI002579F588|nr:MULTISPECIES: hypothetical protein [Sphingobacterium]
MNTENLSIPEIEILGTIFQFDIDRIELIEKANPYNRIYFNCMTDYGTHYKFDYSARPKKLFLCYLL